MFSIRIKMGKRLEESCTRKIQLLLLEILLLAQNRSKFSITTRKKLDCSEEKLRNESFIRDSGSSCVLGIQGPW